MTAIYYPSQSGPPFTVHKENNKDQLESAAWIDLFNPTKEEELAVEEPLHFEIPTKEEMQTIEPSSRLYLQDHALYMTTTMLAFSHLPEAKTDIVTFILTNDKLVRVLFCELT